MRNAYGLRISVILFASTLLMFACGQNKGQGVLPQGPSAPLYAPTPADFRVHLTDAPKHGISSVVVDVDHMEVLVQGGGKKGRIQIASNMGKVDLLKLQNGVLLALADLKMSSDISVTQIRMVLKESGHYIVKDDGSICEPKTPSQQKTGLKIVFGKPVSFEAGYSYAVVIDFDAEKSVVLQGNGGCLLKPVVKMKSFTRIQRPPPDVNLDDGHPGQPSMNDDDDPTNDEPVDTGTGDTGSGSGDTGSGSEESGSGSGGSTNDGSGSEYDVNDPTDPDNGTPTIPADQWPGILY